MLRNRRAPNPETTSRAEIEVKASLCDGCGLCRAFCPVGVFRLEKGLPKIIKLTACYACRSCENLCPHGAIEVTER